MTAGMLSLALGIAASPVPIIAVLAILLGRRARATSLALLAGWALAISGVVTVVALIEGTVPVSATEGQRRVQAVIQLVLAVVALVLAIVSWARRPRPGSAPRLPGWLNAVDRMPLPVAFAIGVALIPLSPKNLLLTVSAGIELGLAHASAGATIAIIAAFTAVAASTVLIPVVAYLLAASRLHGPLAAIRLWLIKHNTVITTVLLLALAVWLAAAGLANL